MNSPEYTSHTYGEAWADVYDTDIIGWPNPAPAVRFLQQRATGENILDLGVGTGRIALPMAATSETTIVGNDISPKMLEVLKEKIARGDSGKGKVIPLEEDISTFEHNEEYNLIYCLGQSFLQLQTQEQQQLCLNQVAKHLSRKGKFVLELLVPDLRRFRVGQDIQSSKILGDRILMTASKHHALNQRIESMTFELGPRGTKMFPNHIRYCWPSEIILMAEKAGMNITGRWNSYSGTKFTGLPGAYIAEFRVSGKG